MSSLYDLLCGYIHLKHHAPVKVKEAKLEKVGSDPEDP